MNSNKTFFSAFIAVLFAFAAPSASLSVMQAQRPGSVSQSTIRPGNSTQRPGPQQNQRNFNPTEFRKKVREFITREAKLTQREADIIFPIFFETKANQRELKHRIDNACQRITSERLTERDCQRILIEVQRQQKQLGELEAALYDKLRQRGILASKILRIKAADEKFRRNMFKNATHRARK